MNELPQFHLSAAFPHGVLPEVFGVVTAAAPQKLLRDDRLHGSILSDALRLKGWQHYPAEVILPSFDEPRVSFAVVENLAKLERLAREFIRPGIFWVQRGEVIQMFFGQKPPKPLGSWDTFSGQPPTTLHGSGNFALLEKPATAFLCSTACPGDKILEAYEWGRRQCDTGGTVISGFHTPVEKDVLAILARRGANLIWVPGRDLPKTLDPVFRTPLAENRLLILSPFPYGKPSRPTLESCSIRNCFILSRPAEHFIPHVADGSALAADLNSIP